MVDAYNLPKSMTKEQLEYWILFGIVVANKPAAITETKLKKFLEIRNRYSETLMYSPFELVEWIINNKNLPYFIKETRFGQYKRITRAFTEAIKLDLDNISVSALEQIHGIGPKTARMIMLYYDPKADCVPLDTHVLKYLRKQGVKKVPKSTPSAGKEYNRLESLFQAYAKVNNISVRELDTQVWLSYAKPKEKAKENVASSKV